jgi:hypothetical protein
MNEGGFLQLYSMITLVQLSLVIFRSPSAERRVRMRKALALGEIFGNISTGVTFISRFFMQP